MSKVKEIDERIARLEKELAEAKAEKDAMWPLADDEYFWIAGDSIVSALWWGDIGDHDLKRLGNIFRTKEEAECAILRLTARKKFLDHGGHEAGLLGREYGNPVYTCRVRRDPDPGQTRLYADRTLDCPTFEIWFNSEFECQKAINSLSAEEIDALCGAEE